MKKTFLLILFLFSLNNLKAQLQNLVLIESFTETGCGACMANDSAYKALMNSKADKVAIINYHCFYKLDTFYMYNKACDGRYMYYKIQGVPAGIINGKEPIKGYSFITYITPAIIDTAFAKPPQIKFELTSTPNKKDNKHSTLIKVKATALKDIPAGDLRLFIAVTENNINHIERYKQKSVYGINDFNNIFRGFLPDTNGTSIQSLKAGATFSTKVNFTNDDKEMNYKEVRIVLYVQDLITGEVYGATVTKEHPF